jgi:hypothetical protein
MRPLPWLDCAPSMMSIWCDITSFFSHLKTSM